MTDYQKAREAAIQAMIGKSCPHEGYEDPDFAGEGLDAALSAFEAHGLMLVPKNPPEAVLFEISLLCAGDSLSALDANARTAYRHVIESALQERQKK